jgi:hypothetical protein
MRSTSLFALVLLAGCVEPEVLDPRDGTVPVGVDFTGTWEILSNFREDQRQLARAISRTDGIDDREIFRQSSRPSNSSRSRSGKAKGGLVYIFLETGESLKITQTDYALFVSFDRSSRNFALANTARSRWVRQRRNGRPAGKATRWSSTRWIATG